MSKAEHYAFPPGTEHVRFRADAAVHIPALLEQYGNKRAFIVASRTLNRETDAVDRIASALGGRLVGRTDEIGEHSPVGNVLRALGAVRESGADVLVAVGGGSVLDFAKFVQLGLSEGVRTRDDLAAFRRDGGSKVAAAPPAIRTVAVPTTFATAEWTGAGTPVDELVGQKYFLMVPYGAARAIVYDPAVVRHTPPSLLLSTGIRGLDHAINQVCSVQPNQFCTPLALNAVRLFSENLPKIAAEGEPDADALANCLAATWFTGMGQMTVPHGFSYPSVHMLAPWARSGHGDAACVMMLAQARWWGDLDDDRLKAVSTALGRPNDPLHEILFDLLRALGRPTSLTELGADVTRRSELVDLLMAYPPVRQNNILPIETANDIAAVLDTVTT